MDTKVTSLALLQLRKPAMLERERRRAEAAAAAAAGLPAPASPPPPPAQSAPSISARGSHRTRLNEPAARATAGPSRQRSSATAGTARPPATLPPPAARPTAAPPSRQHPTSTTGASARPAAVPAAPTNPAPVQTPPAEPDDNRDTDADVMTVPVHLRRLKAGVAPFTRAVDPETVKWRKHKHFGPTNDKTIPAMRFVEKGKYWMPYDWKNALQHGMFVETARAWIEAEYKDHAAIKERDHDNMATLIRHVRRIIASTRPELLAQLTGGNLSRAMFLKERPVYDIVNKLTKLSRELPSIYSMEMVRRRDCQGTKPDELRQIIDVARQFSKERKSDTAKASFEAYAQKKGDDIRTIELDAFLDALDAMLLDMPASEHDQPLIMCMRETGYAKKGEARIEQHEKGNSTNAMMLLFSCIANVLWPGRFMIKGHVIYIIWDEEQGMVAEPFFSSINSAYTRTGRGFTWWPAGLFAKTKSLRDVPWPWGAWAAQEIVANTPILQRLAEDNEAMKIFLSATKGETPQLFSAETEEQIRARGEDAIWLKAQDVVADAVLLRQSTIEDTVRAINEVLDKQTDLRQALADVDESRSAQMVREVSERIRADAAAYAAIEEVDVVMSDPEFDEAKGLKQDEPPHDAETGAGSDDELEHPSDVDDYGAKGDYEDDISEVDEVYGQGDHEVQLRTAKNQATYDDDDDEWARYVGTDVQVDRGNDLPPSTMFDLPSSVAPYSGKGKSKQLVSSQSPLSSMYSFKGTDLPMAQQSFSS